MSESTAPPPPGPAPVAERTHRGAPARQRIGDVLFKLVCEAAALLVIVVALLLLAVLVWKSWLAIRTIGGSFFTTTTWDPEPTHRIFGSLAFAWGTVATSFIAMLIAVPLGVGTAAFLSEIAPGWLRRAGSFFVEMLAAVPSVVYGFWGMLVLAPLLQRIFPSLQGGAGILPAGLILSIMIVPYVAAVSFDVCRAVPRSQRQGALALGATRWQVIWTVVLPYARPGIIGGCFLALGRALGETMAVTMLIGNKAQISLSPFSLGDSIASVIANQFAEADYDLYLSAVVELALVLLLVSLVVNSLGRVLIWRVSRPGQRVGLFQLVGLLRGRGAPQGALGAVLPPVALAGLSPRRTAWMNRVMTVVLGLCLFITVGCLFLILGYLLVRGFSALDLNFFTQLPRPVGEKGGGMANALVGSLILVGLATLLAVPVGLLAAVYLAEYRSERLGPTVRFIGELLGGVPSIVIGLFVYALLVKPLGHFSGWAGAFALAVIMLPVVMRASEEAIKLVPRALRQASFALGATHWQTILRVTLPAALPAIITAIFLAIARVAGETAPLLLTASGNRYWPSSPDDMMPSLPVFIFDYAKSHDQDWHRQAWAAALVLLVVVMILNFGVRLVAGKRAVLASSAD